MQDPRGISITQRQSSWRRQPFDIAFRSERDLVVQLARRTAATAAPGSAAAAVEALVRAGLAEIGTAAAAASGIAADLAAFTRGARVEHLQLAAESLQHDFRRILVRASLVLPFARLQL